MKFLKLSLAILVAISMTTLTSCKSDDDETPVNQHEDAYADVFVKKGRMPAGVRYGLTYYAGGEGLVSCTVVGPDGGDAVELAEYWKGAGNLRKHPSQQDMMAGTTMPTAGNYVFTLTFSNGDTKEITDVLTDVQLDAMTPTTITYDIDTETVSSTWNSVEGAEMYMVVLTEDIGNTGKPIFGKAGIPTTETTYSFDRSTTAMPGWLQADKPATGDVVYLMTVAIKFEEGKTGDFNNRQMVTAYPSIPAITW